MLRRVGQEIDETLYLYAAHLFTWLRKRLVEKALPGLIRNRAQTATRRRVRFRVTKQSFNLAVEIPWAERVQPMLACYPLARVFLIRKYECLIKVVQQFADEHRRRDFLVIDRRSSNVTDIQ